MVSAAPTGQVLGIRSAVFRALAAEPTVAQTKGKTMKLKFLTILALASTPVFAPLAAVAMPGVGDMIGTDPDTAKAALEKAGCVVDEFEAEDGKIEAKCKDTATGNDMEVYIDPASGKVTDIKAED
jgi:Peptidase propeptide and YPEB domain